MKKIQCEVCGSTEIKKVDDDLFECQSCGIQYSKNDVTNLLVEITGEVKIDHAEDIENLTKRAEKFYNDGDKERSIEYYERVLDADPDNENAQNRIEQISKEQEMESAFESVYFYEAITTADKCVDEFFRILQSQKNIAHDIYKEIAIDDVTVSYFPFSFMKASGTLDWSGIRCDKYIENQTVYKDKYNSQTQKYEKVPKTEQVVRVNRTQVNGCKDWSRSNLVLATNDIGNVLKCGNVANSIISNIETRLNQEYDSDNLVKLDAQLLEDRGDAAYYKDVPINSNIDQELVKSKMSNMLSNARASAERDAEYSAGGDYVENMNSRFHVGRTSGVSIFIPLCIVNYTYKNKKFSAIIDMSRNNSFIEMIYPIEKELFDSNKETEELTKKKLNIVPGMAIIIGGGVIGFILLYIYSEMGLKGPEALAIVAIIFMTLGLISGIVDLIVRSNSLKNKVIMATEKNANLIAPRKEYLEKTAAKFINGYSSYDKLSSIQEFLPKSDNEISEILCSESITVKIGKSQKYLNKEDENNTKLIKKLASENKMEAIKKYIEVYGVSLAEAKNAVDKMSENTETDNESLSVDVSDDSDSEKEAVLSEIKKIAAQSKIEAIKKYREVFNADLKEAKEAVDKMLM